ncbi:MAG TPA: YjbE family putative metal transport protein [Ktedonobacterales bacterium]
MLQYLGSLGAIILVDLALSGDNALIIGAAAAGLERRQRTLAILLGGGAAIILRIGFAIAATLLLQVKLLEAIGGLILLVIAVRLLMGRDEREPDAPKDGEAAPAGARRTATLGAAMLTILVADVTMSLDNILAIGGLAHGDIPLLAVGLVISVALLLVGSAIVAELIGRLPWLLDLAAIVLGYTAGTMIFHDGVINPFLHALPYGDYVLGAIGALIVLAIDLFLRWRERRHAIPAAQLEAGADADQVNARGR